jgi:hypothetical protein
MEERKTVLRFGPQKERRMTQNLADRINSVAKVLRDLPPLSSEEERAREETYVTNSNALDERDTLPPSDPNKIEP